MPTDAFTLPVNPEQTFTAKSLSQQSERVEPASAQTLPVSAPSSEELRLEQENRQLKEALAEIKTKYEQLKQEQYQNHYENGFKAGIEEAQEVIQSAVELEKSFLENWHEFKFAFEQEVSKIVLAAVGKILGQALARPEPAMAAVKEVLQSVGYEDKLTVYVSAKDFRVFERYRRQISPNSSIEYVCDDRVTVGGCLVKLDKGMLDGRIEVQLKNLVETLNSVSRG